jgi:spore coat polysaccharide biosynthesis protein SpsF
MIGAIIQVRMNSSRLPGKVMLKVQNKSLLEHMILRIKHCKTVNKIIIATSTEESDDVIEKFCRENQIDYHRGSENDVLERYYESAKKFSLSTIVRLTGDTPLIDPLVIDKVVNYYQQSSFYYVSNIFPLPRTYPDGYNVEVFSFTVLQKTHLEAKRPSDREHVTNFITMQSNLFSIGKVDYEKDISKFRLNLDYYEDYLLIEQIFNHLYTEQQMFHLADIIKFLEENHDIFNLNSKIKPYENMLKSFELDKELGYEIRKENFYINKNF